MKYLLVIVYVIILNINLIAQKQLTLRDKKIVLNAKKYLSDKSLLKNTLISDSITYISYTLVFDILKNDRPNEKSSIDSLLSIDDVLKFKNFRTDLFKNDYKPFNHVAFFSKPFKNTLIVEIVNCTPNINLEYSKITKFTTSTVYLLYFKRNCKVSSIKKIEINYD